VFPGIDIRRDLATREIIIPNSRQTICRILGKQKLEMKREGTKNEKQQER
jgi:hypothetical protein